MRHSKRFNLFVEILVILMTIFFWGCSNEDTLTPVVKDASALATQLENPYVVYYDGETDGGLAHVSYWTLNTDGDIYQELDSREQVKVGKIQANHLHSQLFQPTQVVAGYEATGTLVIQERSQTVSFRVPDNWNGDLIVAGTPGLRNEYANEAILAPWLLDAGYAFVTGDKGLVAGMTTMLNGQHPSQHWGMMMLDLAKWAKARIKDATGREVARTYAIGLSNGGYMVRRALELDHESVLSGNSRLFDAGLDWSGTYFPDARVMDRDQDGIVSVAEFASSNMLLAYIDVATMTMGWAYAPDTLITPENFALDPPFGAHSAMIDAGFSPESAIFWGYYNTNYDIYKTVLPQWKGVGYYNLISYVYRAELRGDDAVQAQAYSCFSDPENPDQIPPLYDWLQSVENGGWNETHCQWALKNANTAEFSVPMITIVGQADGLLALNANAVAYTNAVEQYGNPELHRLYLIENAGHVDAHADGNGDFNFDGQAGDEGVADRLIPMQAYVQRAFEYLTQWVEHHIEAPDSTTISTDPQYDETDWTQIAF